MKDRRKGLLDDGLVLAVEVSGRQRAPGVADDHAVRVQHRNDLERTSGGIKTGVIFWLLSFKSLRS